MGDRLVHSYRYRKQLRNIPSSPTRASHGSLERTRLDKSSAEGRNASLERQERDSSSSGSEPTPPGVETFETATLSAHNKPGMGLTKAFGQ